MPKLYVYLDEQASAERRESFIQIMQRLLPFVHSLENTESLSGHLSTAAFSSFDEQTQTTDLSLQNKTEPLVQDRFNACYQAYLDKDSTFATLKNSLPVQGNLDSQEPIPTSKYHSTGVSDFVSGLMWDTVAQINKWQIIFLNETAYLYLLSAMKNAARCLSKYGQEALQNSEYAWLSGEDLLIAFTQEGAGLSLLREGKMLPLRLDFEVLSYRQRLLRGGRQKEAVSRAVLQGIADGAVVFDATAGLGRESMILAHAGARVLAFERQLPIWIILADALHRAQRSRFFPFVLPELHTLGTIKDYVSQDRKDLVNYGKAISVIQDGNDIVQDGQAINDMNEQSFLYPSSSAGADSWGRPEVIYYDPMFPERESAAQVKKDMFIFQQVIGHDTDTEEFLLYALTLATKRVVVKRPSFAPAVETAEIKRAYAVDGGQCRFDCYMV